MQRMKYSPLVIFSLILIVVGIVPIIYSLIIFPDPPSVRDWNYTNVQLISAKDQQQESFSFAVFGDNKNSISTFNKLISDINRDDVVFSIETGDLIDNMFDGQSEYRTYVKQIEHFTKPLLVIPGNHETEGSSCAYNRLFGRLYYSFHFGDAYFIALNGSHEEGLAPQQYAWLKEELKKSQNYRYRFIFMHVPLYDPEAGEYQLGHSLNNKATAEKLNTLFDINHVTMVFTAHVHGYYTGQWHATPFTITGGAGAELGGTDASHYFNHYVRVNVSPDGVHYEVKKTAPPFSNILTLFIHNVTEFIHSYLINHWDYLLLALGFLGLWLAGRIRKKA